MVIFLFTLFALALGYFFGKFTCEFGVSKKYGILFTASLFVLLNLVHSTIDGSLVLSNNYGGFMLALGHEIIRQPVLYVFFFAMVSPFVISKKMKIFYSVLAVSGVWILGMSIGKFFIQESLAHLDGIEIYMYAFFIGDILHHGIDYIKHKKGIHHTHAH